MGKVEENTLGAYRCTEIYSISDAAIIEKSNWRSRYLNQIGILKTFRLFNPDGSEITSTSPYFYFSDIFLENECIPEFARHNIIEAAVRDVC